MLFSALPWDPARGIDYWEIGGTGGPAGATGGRGGPTAATAGGGAGDDGNGTAGASEPTTADNEGDDGAGAEADDVAGASSGTDGTNPGVDGADATGSGRATGASLGSALADCEEPSSGGFGASGLLSSLAEASLGASPGADSSPFGGSS